ncbi:carboxypeptidase regulatory-like domain-containing protein [Desulfonema magnum]|uniref:Peptidase domains-containing protein n=1 Tax=Desulfonema magnum TaxID=45655 RepID=A0A975GM98_9BACT|nr:carboxypeptidase regulatory-like domain-containing protein [Desulfonema magnum]QTA86592.1 Peptidase domains-containing protein [Desulfonema magnum]
MNRLKKSSTSIGMEALAFAVLMLTILTSAVQAQSTSGISGKITASDGQPIPSICVNASEDKYGAVWKGGGTSDENGNYSFEVPAGSYFVGTEVLCNSENIHLNFHNELWNGEDGTFDVEQAKAVTVVSEKITSDINFSLAEGGRISGKVTSKDGQPIAGMGLTARFECESFSPFMTETDENGDYVFVVPEGTYYVETWNGVQNYLGQWWNNGEGASECNKAEPVSVIKGQTTSDINFSPIEGGTISGKVTTKDGQPIANLEIGAYSNCDDVSKDIYYGCFTDENGNYSVTVSDGEYYLTAWTYNAPEYFMEWWDGGEGTTDCNDAEPITAKTGQTTSDINFSLAESSGVSGRITAVDGQPIANVCVYASDSERSWGAKTDEDGKYLIAEMPEGKYRIQTDSSCEIRQNYADKSWTGDGGVGNLDGGELVSVISGQTAGGINFVLERGGFIEGSIVSADNRPLKDICSVDVYDDEGARVGGHGADENGDYFVVAPPGSYYVCVNASCVQEASYVNECWNGEEGVPVPEEASPVNVTTGQTTPDINFSLNQGGRISGKVITADGEPVPNICVNATDSCGGQLQGGNVTDENGIYSFSVPEGIYFVNTDIFCGGGNTSSNLVDEFWNEAGQTVGCNGADSVTVAAGQITSDINFSLEEGGRISGKVITADGDPVPNICVNATDSCGGSLQGGNVTDENGIYSFSVPEGIYFVNTDISCGGGNTSSNLVDEFWNEAGQTVGCNGADSVTVAAGQTTSDINFSLEEGGWISGKITTANGQPLPNAHIGANETQCGGSVWFETGTDENGNYSVVVPEGDYYINTEVGCSLSNTSLNSAGEFWNGKEGTYKCSESVPVNVVKGEITPNIDFLLADGGRISGRVTTSDGQAVSNIYVYASKTGHWWGVEYTTDKDGYYCLIVPEGSCYVCTNNSWSESSLPLDYVNECWDGEDGVANANDAKLVNVIAGQTTPDINFSLEQGGVISGKVTSADGQPIPNVCVNASTGGQCGNVWQGGSVTDGNGNYSFAVPEGSHFIATDVACGNSNPPRNFVNEIWNGGNGTFHCPNAAPVDVKTGETTENINFSLEEGGIISGKVTSSDDQPIANIEIGTFTNCKDEYNSGFSDENGDYYVALPEGEYQLLAWTYNVPNYLREWWNIEDGASQCDEASSVEVKTGETTSDINFSLATGSSAILSVTPTSRQVSETGGTTRFSVANTDTVMMEWTASGNADWFSIEPSSGTNNGKITVNYDSNPDKARTGTITVTAPGAMNSPQTVELRQSPGFQPILSVIPPSGDLPETGGTATVEITNTGTGTMEWTASGNADWFSIDPSSGTDDGTITINYDANTDDIRVGKITVTAPEAVNSPQIVEIRQVSGFQPVLSVTPALQEIPETDGTTSFTVANTGTGTMEWTVSENADWLSVDPISGTNDGIITVSYDANSGEIRTGKITITATDTADSPQTVEVKQSSGLQPVISVIPESHDFGSLPVQTSSKRRSSQYLTSQMFSSEFEKPTPAIQIASEYIENQVIIKMKPGKRRSRGPIIQKSLNATAIAELPSIGAEVWEVPEDVEDVLTRYWNDPAVEYIEPNYIIRLNNATPDDPGFSELWGLNNTGQTSGQTDADIDAPEAWEIETGNEVVVAVIDSGVDYNHPDLATNMWKNPGEIPDNGIDDDGNDYVDDVYGYDFINGDSDPYDGDYHGTHCAGTIAAVGNNGIGITGVNWSAKIMALKAGRVTDAVRAIGYAVKMGAKITSNSWGIDEYSRSLHEAIQKANDAGQLFIAAAGNDGLDNDSSPHYPSSYTLDNIIAVASTDRHDHRSSFSNYGLTSVDLGAPGSAIYSTIPNGYRTISGTSMATPHVSGVASLIWSKYPWLTATQVKEAILSSVDPVADLQGKTVTGGRLNAYNALVRAGQNQQIFTVSNIGGDDLAIGQLSVSSADFYMQDDTCSGQTITPGESRTVKVFFKPKSTGMKTASLIIPSNDPDVPTLNVTLTGQGVTDDDDNDGMTNQFESQYGLNLNSADDASEDSDNDGLTNLEESELGTNPVQEDTDGDGMPDDYEFRYNLNPFNPFDAQSDSDGDGYTNFQEYRVGTAPSSYIVGEIDLGDAILGLKMLVGIDADTHYLDSDINGDGKITLSEVIYILQKASGMR